MIQKSGGKYKVVSEKTHNGKHKNLGTYTSRDAAKHRIAQVEYFKHLKSHGKPR